MPRVLPATRQGLWGSEQELVVAVRRGHDSAFEELFSRYQPRIGAYVGSIVGDHGRVEDLTQEVFLSALRRLRDTERPIAFKPWIYEIAKNACIDELRRTRRRLEVPLDDQPDSPQGAHDLLSRELTPDAAVETKQRLADLRGAFRALSETYQRILVLRELEGLTYDEIGERLGMSRAVVESTLFRARRRLAEEYEELISGRRCERTRAVIDASQARPLRRLGIRELRQLARHLAHCQHCRRHAWIARFDDSVLTAPATIRKIGGPIPVCFASRRRMPSGEDALAFGALREPRGVRDPVAA